MLYSEIDEYVVSSEDHKLKINLEKNTEVFQS